MRSGSFKNVIYKMCLEIKYLIIMYKKKKDLALNNLQRLICRKTKPNQTRKCVAPKNGAKIYTHKRIYIYIYIYI